MIRTKDIIEFDMSPEGASFMNKRIKISKNVFYFSYSYNAVINHPNGQVHKPLNTDFFFLKITSNLMLKNSESSSNEHEYENDGLVNVSSASHPENEPFKKFNGDFFQGVWNVMPTKDGDHGTPIGLFDDKEQTKNFYTELIEILEKSEYVFV